ncbi:hypothetical protein HRD68_16690 [Yersinia massiliensis]|uniref:hypothetical protein n=1 Tax=Yersinia massiliensis TaxID=419257 RepID=UPI00156282AD|nr:hypothetical protein [Yersinia massiliensis]QKJ12223.1 hypothetical protein HRD68_16690 [Yersinia massiliensis]
MDITKSREEFEAEFRKQHAGNAYIEMLLKMYNHGTDEDPEIDYYSLAARDAWKWWQVSRRAIEVILPPAINTEEIGKAISKEITMARLAIAGIRIKGESE